MTFTSAEFAIWMSIAKDISVVGLLLFILWGGSRRVWIWGHHYVDSLTQIGKLEEEIDWWQTRYLSMTDTTSRALTVAERRFKK